MTDSAALSRNQEGGQEPSEAATTCLVAIAFEDPLLAQEALLAAARLQRAGRLMLDDAAIVSKTSSGKVRIMQTRDLNPVNGAMSGGWWGVLAGLFVGGPLLGAALGAGLGGLWAKLHDVGIDDDEMKRLGEELPQGQAALFCLVSDAHRAHVYAELRRFDGRLFADTLDAETRAKVEESLGAGVIKWA